MGDFDEEQFLIDVVRRLPLLTELRAGPRTRRELTETLGTSKTTIHRATTALAEAGLVERRQGKYCLTGSGEAVTRNATTFQDRTIAARRLAPLYETIADCPVDIDPGLFADATVTVAAPGDPYAPVRRFMSLVDETDELRGFDTTTIGPNNFEDVAERIRSGMQTEVIYEPAVVEQQTAAHPDEAVGLVESDNLEVLVHDDLPFGLTLFEDRVGIGGYGDETGILRTYADTDDPDAIAWGERLYERYRSQAEPLVPSIDAR